MNPSGPTIDPRVTRTRAVVLEAASELLADEGFERVTIDAIADRSGVARSTISRRWPDRAELLAEVFQSVCTPEPIADEGSLAADLRARSRDLADGLGSQRWGQMLPSLVGAAAHDPELRAALDRFNDLRRDETLVVLVRAQERGEATIDVDLEAVLERWVGPFFLRHLMTSDPLDSAFVERQVAAACAELGAPYAPPA